MECDGFGVGKQVVSSPVRAGSEAHTTPGRSKREQEENSRGIEDNRFSIASGKLSLGTNWLRDADSYWSESLIKKQGQAPVQLGAIGFQSRCVIGAVPGTGHARGLRPCGSPGSPAAFERSGCALVWNRKEYGLINATCGLGGPHYARKQQQPHARSPPSPPIPLLPPAGEGGPRFYFLRGDLCWKRGESTLCETAQQPVLLQDPLPAAA